MINHSARSARGSIPYSYSQYEYLGGVRSKIAIDLVLQENLQILDVGTGNGLFAIALSKVYRTCQILGIDTVKAYIEDAINRARKNGLESRCNFSCMNFFDNAIPTKHYNVITFFLSICDLLRWSKVGKILQRCSELLKDKGQLVICEQFPEEAVSPQEKLGFKIQLALGYRYPSRKELFNELHYYNFKIKSVTTYHTGRPPMSPTSTKNFIKDECFFCSLDGSQVASWQQLWYKFKPYIFNIGSIEIDSKVFVIRAEK
jgi:ubiquinone/menaquinone biosynthesis C-methylase UbiE